MRVIFDSKFDKNELVYVLAPCKSMIDCSYSSPTIIRGCIKNIHYTTNRDATKFFYEVHVLKAYDLYSGNEIDLKDPLHRFDNDVISIHEEDLIRDYELDRLVNSITNAVKNVRKL